MTYTFEELLDSWEDSVENFLLFVVECCGLLPSSDTYMELQKHVITMDDLKRWIDIFRGNMDEIEWITKLYLESMEVVQI